MAQSKDIKAGYYLTIAAYAKNKEQYAIAYRDKVRGMGLAAEYGFFPKKNYYFVYLKYYTDFNTAIRDLYQTRKKPEFDDCWVYVMRQTEVVEKALNKEVSSLGDMFAARFGDTSEEEQTKDSAEEEVNSADLPIVNNDLSADGEQVVLSAEDKTAQPNTDLANTSRTDTEAAVSLNNDDSKHVFLSLFYGRNGKEVRGQVQLIDATNHTLIKKYDGNKVINMKNPDNGNGDLILISDVFGYKKVQHDFNFEEPLDDEEFPYVTSIEDTVIVNFELSRYSKGDIITMYNVFFFKDAAIMRPQSKFEIKELVAMLKENPNMKIRIHGHTNGRAHGKIITLKEGSTNFFSLSGDNKSYIGSSKKLSHERASVMKQYLINNDINPSRISTKAWGGKSEIHDRLSSLAHKNVRVEIEVVED
jgi:outer membrane protein OmpA-like peptidoglycan-associated protein